MSSEVMGSIIFHKGIKKISIHFEYNFDLGQIQLPLTHGLSFSKCVIKKTFFWNTKITTISPIFMEFKNEKKI